MVAVGFQFSGYSPWCPRPSLVCPLRIPAPAGWGPLLQVWVPALQALSLSFRGSTTCLQVLHNLASSLRCPCPRSASYALPFVCLFFLGLILLFLCTCSAPYMPILKNNMFFQSKKKQSRFLFSRMNLTVGSRLAGNRRSRWDSDPARGLGHGADSTINQVNYNEVPTE